MPHAPALLYSGFRKLPRLLALLFLAAVADSRAQPPAQFEVASIKLNTSGTTTMKFPPPAQGRFSATNFPLKALISFAYGVLGSQISGAPGWIDTERFDVEARAADTNATREQYPQMLRSLLTDRFRLNVHTETKDLPVYELSLTKTGARLPSADPNACDPAGTSNPAHPTCGAFFTGPSSLEGRSMTLAAFCNALGIVLGRPVADRTGLDGRFDIHLEFDPDGVNLGTGSSGLSPDGDKSDSSKPSIFSALPQQLGLQLQSHKEPAHVLVIDRLDRFPSGN